MKPFGLLMRSGMAFLCGAFSLAALAAEPVLNRLTLANGVSLEYAEQGPADGPLLILVHGFPDSWFAWRPLMAALPADLHVIAISQRGFGASDHPATGYTISGLADDLSAFMDKRGLQKAVIVGHSMGSLVAARFAAGHPDRVSGLVMIGTFRQIKGDPSIEAFWHESIEPLEDPIDPAFARAFQEGTVARPTDPAFMDALVRESLKAPARVWKALFADIMQQDFQPTVEAVTAPILFYWGDLDIYAPKDQRQSLIAAAKSPVVVVEPGAGHSPHWEDPAAAAGFIAGFIRERLTRP